MQRSTYETDPPKKKPLPPRLEASDSSNTNTNSPNHIINLRKAIHWVTNVIHWITASTARRIISVSKERQSFARSCSVEFSSFQCCVVLYCAVRYSSVQFCAVLPSIVIYSSVLLLTTFQYSSRGGLCGSSFLNFSSNSIGVYLLWLRVWNSWG